MDLVRLRRCILHDVLQLMLTFHTGSMGTTDRVEHSIQNAYLKAIQLSEHFVYIENRTSRDPPFSS